MIGAGLCNIVATAIRCPVFVHPYLLFIVKITYNILGEVGRLTNDATTLGSVSHTGCLMNVKRRNPKKF
jgi:hypothetical protein